MTQVDLSDQELFEIIIALHTFDKTGAVSPMDENEALEIQEVARQRKALLDKLHDAFDESAMLARR